MASREHTVAWRVAAVSALVVGLGFGLPGVYGTWYFADRGAVWYFLGFPSYGDGPFADVGVPTSVPLLVAFVLVCAAEVVLGVLLWRRAGDRLALWLLPVELAFWLGFALPFGYLAGALRTGALLVARPWERGATDR